MGCVEFAGVDGCGFVGAVGRVVVDLLVQMVAGFWVVGRRLWVVICVLSMSFPVGMLDCEDVYEISNEFDLLLGLDCRVGHDGEGVGLWWGRVWWRGVVRLLNAK